MHVTRRRFGAVTGGTVISLAFGAACHASDAQQGSDGRIAARPRKTPGKSDSTAGARALGLASGRDALIHMPANVTASKLPLLVLLHGAGGSGAGILKRLGAAAEKAGIAVLAPDSRDGTWDAIRGSFGPDVMFLNRALERVFDTVLVDPAKGHGRRILRWRDVCPFARADQRRAIPADPRVLARLYRGGLAPRQAAHLRLAWHRRSHSAHRSLQPRHRSRAQEKRVRRDVPRVRGRSHGAAGDRRRRHALGG